MSFERNKSSKPLFENGNRIIVAAITAFLGAGALYLGTNKLESSNPDSATLLVDAKETLAQNILDGQRVDIAKENLIYGEISIVDPAKLTLKTGDEFLIGIKEGSKNNPNMNQFQLANNEVAVEVNGPISNVESGVRVSFNSSGQLTNEANGRVIASAQIN